MARGDGVRRTCAARINEGGRPCRAAPLKDGTRCFLHDPAHAEDAAKARALGGHRRRRSGVVRHGFDLPDLRSLAGVQRVLEIAIEDALVLENGIARTRTLIYAVSVAGRLSETLELDDRITALERALRRAGGPERPGWLSGSALDGRDLDDPDAT